MSGPVLIDVTPSSGLAATAVQVTRPAARAAGDLEFVLVAYRATTWLSWPGGFDLVANYFLLTEWSADVHVHVCDGSEAPGVVSIPTGAGTTDYLAFLVCYSGVSVSEPYGTYPTGEFEDFQVGVSSMALSALTGLDRAALLAVFCHESDTQVSSAPAGMSLVGGNSITSIPGVAIDVFDEELVDGSSGDKVATWPDAANAFGLVIAINALPAVVDPPPPPAGDGPIPDAEVLAQQWAAANASLLALVDGRVATRLPSDPESKFPFLRVVRVAGGRGSSEAPLDVAVLQWDAYAAASGGQPDYATASLLARTLVAELAAAANQIVGADAWLYGFSAIDGPRRIDEPETGWARFQVDCLLALRRVS